MFRKFSGAKNCLRPENMPLNSKSKASKKSFLNTFDVKME